MSAQTWTFGPGGMYTAAWDGAGTLTVTLTSGGAFIASFSGASLAALTASPAYLALSSSPAGTPDPIVADIQPLGTQATGGTGRVPDAAHVHPAPGWVLADSALLAVCTEPDNMGAGGGALTAGTLYLTKIPIRYALLASNLLMVNATAGAGASTGSFAGLYSSSGTLLTGSADTGVAWTSTGLKTFALTTPQQLAAGTFVWGAMLVNLATTQPNPRAFANGAQAPANLGLAAAVLRCATNGTGLTTLPASITPASNGTAAAVPYWMGLS